MEQKISHKISSLSNIPCTSGLGCHYQFQDGSSQVIFLHIDRETGATSINLSLSFCTKDRIRIVSSFSFLLLLCSVEKNRVVNYHVLNLHNKKILTLPQSCVNHRVIRSGFGFDGNHFHVVLVYVEENRTGSSGAYLGLQIFSSKTEKWKRCNPENFSLPFPVPQIGFPEVFPHPVYANGAIYWEINGHLLVYQINSNHCKLIELPNSFQEQTRISPFSGRNSLRPRIMKWLRCPFTRTKWGKSSQAKMSYQRYLWETEGRVHYCYADSDGVHIWNLLTEEDHDSLSFYTIYDREKFSWRLAHCIPHANLQSTHPRILEPLSSDWEPYNISIFAAEASHTLYLGIPGIVLSYDMKSCRLEKFCSFTYPAKNFSCCSFFDFKFSGPCCHQIANKGSESLEEVKLPISEKLDPICFA